MKYTVLLVLIALLSMACQPPPANNAVNTATAGKADWDGYVAKFLDGYFAANPTFAVYQGKHGVRRQVPGLE